jgi:hypothetical protein
VAEGRVSTARARLRDFLPSARELALLFGVRGLACIAAWHAGFRALSDDDYARIGIAQRFAHAPHFDPTSTSWLPAPFWIYGAIFRLFGTDLGVARATAIAAGLAATVLLYVAARLLGADRLGAMLGAVFSTALVPYSALLGIAALPEVPCAAVLVFAIATLSQREFGIRVFGASSLLVACLSRYEAWPIALVFASSCCWDALRARQPELLWCAILALAGPALWLILGRMEHGDALFFVARVTAYRRALGGAEPSLLRRLIEYPRLMLWDGLLLWPILLVLWFWPSKRKTSDPFGYFRALLALSALLAFLMLGSVRDGVPTHHAARVLLPIWFFASLIGGHAMSQSVVGRAGRGKAGLVAGIIATLPLRPALITPDEGFAERSAELDAGAKAQRYTRKALAIDTPDYGFFAVQAGFGSPNETIVIDDHDPRHPSANPFLDAAAAERVLREHGAEFAVISNAHAALLKPRCSELWSNGAFVLLRCPLDRN